MLHSTVFCKISQEMNRFDKLKFTVINIDRFSVKRKLEVPLTAFSKLTLKNRIWNATKCQGSLKGESFISRSWDTIK